MKTKCYATLNRDGFPLLNARANPFLPCTTKQGAWMHETPGKVCSGGRYCQHHEFIIEPERVEAPSAGTDCEAPQIPLALMPGEGLLSRADHEIAGTG